MTEETILQSKVPPSHNGQSLLDYLSNRFRYQSRETWETLIQEGKVTLNDSRATPSQILHARDKVAYFVVLQEPVVDPNIKILHDEETFLVAIKPGNLPSHADGNFIKNTFIYILKDLFKKQGFTGNLNLVHRLDRETSGLLVVSKDKQAHQNLTRQFETGQVLKEYLAIARGVILEDYFEIKDSMGQDPQSQLSIRQKVVPSDTPFAKKSWTQFEKIKALSQSTFIRCIPKTGRTNQIRVHLDSIGHSIVGDKLYGRSDEEFLAFVHHVKAGGDPSWPGHTETARHMLHASKLGFHHPQNGQSISFEAPLPEDFIKYLASQDQNL